jgi:hypothetical protein
VAAALDDFEEVFATLREAGLLVANLLRLALRTWSMRLPPAGTCRRARHARLRS